MNKGEKQKETRARESSPDRNLESGRECDSLGMIPTTKSGLPIQRELDIPMPAVKPPKKRL